MIAKKILLITLFIIFYNCNGKSINNINEVIKIIEKEYNTNVTYKIGTSLKSNRNISFIKIKIKGGNVINSYEEKKYIPASNIAILVFENITNKFDEYRIEIIDDNNESMVRHYTLNGVKLFIKKREEFNLINSFIIDKKFDLLYKKFKPSIVKGTKKDLITPFEDYDRNYGVSKNIIIHGYIHGNFKLNEDNLKYVAYFGIIKREETDTKVSVFIDQYTNEILSFKFDW